MGQIQDLELIGEKGKGLDQDNFNLDDWKDLRTFYNRIEGEVSCKGIPTSIRSLTEKAVQSKHF
jgi:hypothetical protein